MERVSRTIDYLTSKRWFYALLYILGFLVLLPYASKGCSWPEMWDVIKEVVAYNAIIYKLVDLASPLYIFSRKYMPYAGKQKVSLLVVYPSTLKSSNLDKFAKYLASLFEEMNFGKIDSCSRHSYNYDPENLSESLTSLEKTLQEILPSQDQLKYLPLVIIPDNENFFMLSKEIASRYGFHSQIVSLETFDSVIKCLSEIEKLDSSNKTKQKLLDAVKSLVANICGGIYVEFLIQKSIAKREVSGPLTWVLADPADEQGQSMYVGYLTTKTITMS